MKRLTETFVAFTIWIVLGAITIATLLGLVYLIGNFLEWLYKIFT